MKKVLTAFILCKSKVLWERIYGRIAETEAVAKIRAERSFLGHPRGIGILRFRHMTDSFANYGMMAVLVYYLLSKKLAIGKGFRE